MKLYGYDNYIEQLSNTQESIAYIQENKLSHDPVYGCRNTLGQYKANSRYDTVRSRYITVYFPLITHERHP